MDEGFYFMIEQLVDSWDLAPGKARRDHWSKYSLIFSEDLVYWKCQDCGVITKDDSRCRVQKAWDRKQAMCAVDDKTRETELAKPFDIQNIINADILLQS